MTVFTMDDLYRKMYDLKLLIRNILIKSKRTWDEPRGQIEYDTNDPDKPIKATSVLYKNSNNRYEDDVQEYSCGMGIEVLIPGDKPCWEFSRVEATEDGRYFIVGHGDLEMAGLQTRYRE